MNKHTKGPWFLEYTDIKSRHNSTKFRVETEDGNLICSTGNIKKSDHGFYEQEANARLIAAAPEMLEVLEQVVLLIEQDSRMGQTYDSLTVASGISREINSVIAKARGES